MNGHIEKLRKKHHCKGCGLPVAGHPGPTGVLNCTVQADTIQTVSMADSNTVATSQNDKPPSSPFVNIEPGDVGVGSSSAHSGVWFRLSLVNCMQQSFHKHSTEQCSTHIPAK